MELQLQTIVDTVMGVGTLGFLVGMRRVFKTPKRLDRLEESFVPALRGVWALLKVQVAERNGDVDPEIKKAYDDLTETITSLTVSRRSK